MNTRLVKLISNEGDIVEVEEHTTCLSTLLTSLINSFGTEEPIPIPAIKTQTLRKIVDYLHLRNGKAPGEIEKPLRSANLADVADEEDVKFVDLETDELLELILAANFLNISSLLDLACGKVASLIKGRKVEEIRALFNIKNDFTPEQEAKIREENKWCDDF